MLGKVRRDDGNDIVRNRGEGSFLLKQVQPVVPESREAAGRLTEKNIPRKLRLQERAGEVEEHIREAGGFMLVSDLERQIRRGGLTGLLKVLRRNRLTIRGFLKMYNDRFTTRGGYVRVKETAPTDTPAPVPLAEQIRLSDARNAMLKAARKETAKSRLKGLADVYKFGR